MAKTPAQQKAQAAAEQSRARAQSAAAVAVSKAKAKAQPASAPAKGVSRPTTPVPGGVTAPAAGTPASPAAPAPVNPFLTPQDFDAINAFYTDLNTKLATITGAVGTFDPATGKWSGGTEEADTAYQTTQTDNAARQNTSSAQDDAISRGIFQSSVKDATLYDIEAQRSLSDKFLQDKLTTDRLNAGTQMQTLATSKKSFDDNYGSVDASGNPIWGRVAFQNAQGVNDTNNSAWATAYAAWAAANPAAANPPAAPTTVANATKPAAAPKPQLTASQATAKTNNASQQSSNRQAAANAVAQAKAKAKPKKFYG